MAELMNFANRVANIADPAAVRRILNEGGMAGKKAALEAAARDLGGDRSMSGFRRRVPLGAGFDRVGSSSVQINFRPGGLWRLASQGRQSSGVIRPRRRGGKRAVLTPQGPRARSSYRQSRGLNTFDDAVRESRRQVPKAAFRQFQAEVGRAMRG